MWPCDKDWACQPYPLHTSVQEISLFCSFFITVAYCRPCRQCSTHLLGFGTGRQKMALERWTKPKHSRRTCSSRYRLQSRRGKSAGVAKRPRKRASTRKPNVRFANCCIVCAVDGAVVRHARRSGRRVELVGLAHRLEHCSSFVRFLSSRYPGPQPKKVRVGMVVDERGCTRPQLGMRYGDIPSFAFFAAQSFFVL
jgi:hypothetical protein